MDIYMPIPLEIARELYSSLMSPTKDREGHTVYVVNVTLAGEVRQILADAMAVMK